MLRNHLVCSINDEHMQRCLLAEPEVTCKKAMQLAQVTESAEQNVHDLQKSSLRELHTLLLVKRPQAPRRTEWLFPPRSSTSPSQSSASVRRPQPPTPCLRCAGSHWARDCQFRTSVCHDTFAVPVARRATTSNVHRKHTSFHRTLTVYLCRKVISTITMLTMFSNSQADVRIH